MVRRKLNDRSERETVIILNDLGEISVTSNSPTQMRRLKRRLGAPLIEEDSGMFAQWEIDTTTHRVVLPSKRRARPAKERNGTI